jgi:hypothetical protein
VPCLYEDRFIPGLRQLTDAVHAHGAGIAAQIFHQEYEMAEIMEAMRTTGREGALRKLRAEMQDFCNRLTQEKIQEIENRFVALALRARLAVQGIRRSIARCWRDGDAEGIASVLAEVVDFGPTSCGTCSGVFENSMGGRVAVLGYYPWRSLQSLAKSAQMKTLLRWLSRDRLPAYVSSLHRTALWCRRDSSGMPALLLLNASIDAAEDVRLCVHGGGEAARLLGADGHTATLARKYQDVQYAVYGIDRIGPWQAALVRA